MHPKPHETAFLLKLHASPIYFYKKGKGSYKPAPEVALKAALAGIEKKRQQALIQASYVEELKAKRLPAGFVSLMPQLLFKPDKNSIEYKALEIACNELHTTRERLMLEVGAIASTKELHLSKFLLEQFPKGTGFPFVAPIKPPTLPLAQVQAFSIDDVTTTEIDDAFSVTMISDDKVLIGIHIAAPGLAIQRDDTIDAIARQRLSTVYMPGDKITMLPDALVDTFTLAANKTCPAVSLYVTLALQDWSIISTETKAEAVPIVANLRHNDLDAVVTEENLLAGFGDYPHKTDIALLWQWAQELKKAAWLSAKPLV